MCELRKLHQSNIEFNANAMIFSLMKNDFKLERFVKVRDRNDRSDCQKLSQTILHVFFFEVQSTMFGKQVDYIFQTKAINIKTHLHVYIKKMNESILYFAFPMTQIMLSNKLKGYLQLLYDRQEY